MIHKDTFSKIRFKEPFQSFDDPNMISFYMVTKPLPFTENDIIFGNEGTEWIAITVDEYLMRPDAIKRQQDGISNYFRNNPR